MFLIVNKSLGPSDTLTSWPLKDSISVIAEPLCFLINAFLKKKFPSDLKQAHVRPIFKKSDTEDPNNYRHISISAALSKVFEKKSFVNKLPFMSIIRNCFPPTIWFQKKPTTDALVFTTRKINVSFCCSCFFGSIESIRLNFIRISSQKAGSTSF